MVISRPLTLNEILDILEESDDDSDNEPLDICVLPAAVDPGIVTDEDSGQENCLDIANLPPLLLSGEAEIQHSRRSNRQFAVPDIVSVSEPAAKRQKRKTTIWKKIDILAEEISNENIPIEPECNSNESDDPNSQFKKFIDQKFVQCIVEATNAYCEMHNEEATVTTDEVYTFIGILLLSGYNIQSRRRMYWETAKDTHNDLVADSMSRDRFEYLLSHIHFAKTISLDSSDRYAKVRPIYDMLNERFQVHAPAAVQHSIDEQMVPYFGRHGCKQYIHGKPIRYGYKLWIGATHKGYIVWMALYQGAGTLPDNQYKPMGLGAAVVLSYSDVIKKCPQFTSVHLYFDNLFTSIPLLEELKSRNVKGTGTIRDNRVDSCPLPKKKDLRKKERGWYDFRRSDNDILVCAWNDNSPVMVASNSHSVEPAKSVQRWSSKQKKHITIKQPQLIHKYNQYMGGVDRADQNISLYRTSIRGKKWYFPLIAHSLDLAMQNAWQLHKIMNGKLDHLAFRRRIATALLETHGKASRPIMQARNSANVVVDSRYDRLDHLLQELPRCENGKIKQLKCHVCHTKATSECKKCHITLHLKCNVAFHTRK